MAAITQSLVKLAENLGVKFNYHARVEEILVEDKKVKGIRLNEKIYLPTGWFLIWTFGLPIVNC